MVLPLRQRHRRIMIALGIILPVALSLGVAARKPAPTLTSLPADLAIPEISSATTVWDRSDLFAKTAIQVQLFRDNNIGSRFSLKLSAAKNFVKPDLIVYWLPEDSKSVNSLPESALLLGSFHSSSLVLPVEAAVHPGVLVLYSLANGEIVDISKPLRITDSAK
jgi:hypothetical protein